ncbi:hypothetical protein NKR19_g9444 [Coniochaeta hoffmannii]|uniref:CBM1 domain-containing protein n=1 Tax=Coniochaeta hoffmannii TaxID=91930 RepID=A0AA38VBE2_9PEZI|nr:hypothetical protein NKR19_g9444 [Coniochaeta hoffmannii]
MLAQRTAAAPHTKITTEIDVSENRRAQEQTEHTGIPVIHGIMPREDHQQVPGSDCPGSEGQWNCMTTSWQRCAAGKWSVPMQCAAGTACVPAGLTYDFKVQFAGGQGQGQGSGGGSSAPRVTRLHLASPLVLMAAAVVTTAVLYV